MIKRIISYFHTLTLYPAARAIVTFQSERQRWRTIGKKPSVHFEAPYAGQRIMLLALYEKGELRPDVVRLIEAARAEGLYVLAVNTLKLRNPAEYKELIDCYIERPNFGRDFGSYKTGFLHVFNNKWHETCPRLLMINDSIFFSAERMPKFLNDMMTSETEVLGATENYEIEYHLGSFCIAMSQSILSAEKFQKYWRNYRLTDVRPRVIKRGEMKLSKTLKRCLSAPDEMDALYGSVRFHDEAKKDFSLLKFSIENARNCNETPARRLNLKSILGHLEGSLLHSVYPTQDIEMKIESSLAEANAMAFVSKVEDIQKVIQERLADFSQIDEEKFNQALHAVAVELFMRHSQIHQNATTLIHMGLPIIKLDLIYRGMADISDVNNITKLLDQRESKELAKILLARPYGEHVLFGWRKAAFMSGLI
ncbi:rhamnan synthesis F family protein [Celeribacter halophilus]|uniref:rhamnan synthesis F family protein n=1 Tax=Celeribacter halophilus TaxID=576117 RepID=UPI001C08FB84|nr:rhamnan synthesis F family protein [Celeribacter halophilus]MBU2888863.1 rhamnan synthesis F family protein [Celeribacter halophilus]MDO6511981.1 rhamnan synthesis F family protein [Celeribacter halophilus]